MGRLISLLHGPIYLYQRHNYKWYRNPKCNHPPHHVLYVPGIGFPKLIWCHSLRPKPLPIPSPSKTPAMRRRKRTHSIHGKWKITWALVMSPSVLPARLTRKHYNLVLVSFQLCLQHGNLKPQNKRHIVFYPRSHTMVFLRALGKSSRSWQYSHYSQPLLAHYCINIIRNIDKLFLLKRWTLWWRWVNSPFLNLVWALIDFMWTIHREHKKKKRVCKRPILWAPALFCYVFLPIPCLKAWKTNLTIPYNYGLLPHTITKSIYVPSVMNLSVLPMKPF